MGEYPENFGETVGLDHVEEFKLFEFEAVLGIDYQ